MELIELKEPNRDRQGAMRSAPSSSPWEALNAAVANVVRLMAAWKAAYTAIEEAKREEVEAVAEKRAAAVQLRVDGKSKQPSNARVEAAKEKIRAAEEEYEVLKDAVSQAIALVPRLRDEHQAEWQNDADELADTAHARYGKAVAAMIAARREWYEAAALAQWVATGNAKLAAGSIAGAPWAKVENELRIEAGLEDPAPYTNAEQVAHIAKHGPPLGPDGKQSPTMVGATAEGGEAA